MLIEMFIKHVSRSGSDLGHWCGITKSGHVTAVPLLKPPHAAMSPLKTVRTPKKL
jgi:hypothetical protein